jgi:hypothetical protein
MARSSAEKMEASSGRRSIKKSLAITEAEPIQLSFFEPSV